MLVKNWMSQRVITVDANETIKVANSLLFEYRIRSIPVLSDGKLVGIVTDRDLKQASISQSVGLEPSQIVYLNTRIKVGAIMTENVITVSPDMTVDEVAKILLKQKISGAPVMDQSGNLVGMITQGDIFRLLISVAGIESDGIQIAVQITTETGSVKEVANIIRGNGGRIGNLLTSFEGVQEGYRNAFFKSYNIDPSKMDNLINQLQQKAKIRYIIEHYGDDRPKKVWLMNI